MTKLSIIGVKGYPVVYGGYETLVHSLINRMPQKEVQITVYCHSSFFDKKPEVVNGVKLVYLPAIEKKSLSQLTHSLLSTFHACFSNVDIVFYVNVANAPFGLLPRFFGKKTIINVDGLEWLRPKWKGVGAFYYKLCAKMVKYFFNTIVTDALEMQRIYKSTFNTTSTVITYGAENAVKYSENILSKFNLIPREYYLVVGRMIPDNNLDLIVDAYLSAGSQKKLVIIGDDIFKGDFAKTIEAKIGIHQRIVLTGYVNDHDTLCTFYKNCFAYIHGHEFGGTNPTMITALNEGSLVLALDTPFTREMLNNGQHGIFFTKKISSLSNLMMSIEVDAYHQAAEDFRKKGKSWVAEKYNWNSIAAQYHQLFKEHN